MHFTTLGLGTFLKTVNFFPTFPTGLSHAPQRAMARGAEIEIAIEKASKNPNTESQEFLGATKKREHKKPVEKNTY